MSTTILMLVRTPDGPVPWLFDDPIQAEIAERFFNEAGIYPTIWREGLWNDSHEVDNAVSEWHRSGELAVYRALNQSGKEWPV